MTKRKHYWLPIVIIAVLQIAFLVGLVGYVLAVRNFEDAGARRLYASWWVHEIRKLRQGMEGRAEDFISRSNYYKRLEYNELLNDYRLFVALNAFNRLELAKLVDQPESLVDSFVSLFRKSRKDVSPPANQQLIEDLFRICDQLAEMEQKAMSVAVESAASNDGSRGPHFLKNDEYRRLQNKLDIIMNEIDGVVFRAGNHIHQDLQGLISTHLGWLVSLGVLQVLALLMAVWMLKMRFSRIERRAFHDALTELPNRHYLELYLKWVCQRAEARGEVVILAFMDLNGFKPINDALGHEYGDSVLKYIAANLRKHSRPGDLASRFGGDEFVLVFVTPANRCRQSLQRMTKLVHDTFDEPCHLGRGISFGCSVGISVFPSRAKSLSELIDTADRAMYEAKRLSKKAEEEVVIFEHKGDMNGSMVRLNRV